MLGIESSPYDSGNSVCTYAVSATKGCKVEVCVTHLAREPGVFSYVLNV